MSLHKYREMALNTRNCSVDAVKFSMYVHRTCQMVFWNSLSNTVYQFCDEICLIDLCDIVISDSYTVYHNYLLLLSMYV